MYIYIHIYSHLVAIVFYVYTELIVFYVYKSIGFIVNIQILIHISIYIYTYIQSGPELKPMPKAVRLAGNSEKLFIFFLFNIQTVESRWNNRPNLVYQ